MTTKHVPCDPALTAVEGLAREVLRLRETRDDCADAFDHLVRRVWEAATGDTHEGPASVDVLLDAITALRTRATAAEAREGALLAAVREWAAADEALTAADAAYTGALADDAGRAALDAAGRRSTAADEALRALRDPAAYALRGVWAACDCDRPEPRAHRLTCPVTLALTGAEDIARWRDRAEAAEAELAAFRARAESAEAELAMLRAALTSCRDAASALSEVGWERMRAVDAAWCRLQTLATKEPR